MSRNIIIQKKVAGAEGDDPGGTTQAADNYVSQIVKLIPVEIVGVYLGISNLIQGQYLVQTIVFGVILLITPFYLKKVAKIDDNAHIIVATVSYVIWALSLGGPFEWMLGNVLPKDFTVQALGGILIMLYTLIVPMFYKPSSAT